MSDAAVNNDCAPLSLTRAIADYPIGNIPVREHQQAAIAAGVVVRQVEGRG